MSGTCGVKNRYLIFLVLLFLVSGCDHAVTTADLGITQEKSPVPGNLKLDRQGAWAAVAITQLDAEARIKEAEAEKAKAEAEAARAGASEQLIIDTAEDLEIYREIQRDKMLMEMTKQNARIAEAALNALTPQQKMELPPQPKGVVAEVIDSTGVAVEKVANTNTALAGTVGALVAGASSGDTIEINGDENNLSGRDLSVSKSTTSIVETVNEEVN